MSAFINLLLGFLFDHGGVILTGLASGTGVAIVLQVIKHYGKLQDAKKTVMALLAVLSYLASFSDQLFSFASSNMAVLALHNLGWIVTVAIFVHRFAVSPLYYKVLNVVNTYNQNLIDATAYRQQQALAAAQTAVPTSQELSFPQQ